MIKVYDVSRKYIMLFMHNNRYSYLLLVYLLTLYCLKKTSWNFWNISRNISWNISCQKISWNFTSLVVHELKMNVWLSSATVTLVQTTAVCFVSRENCERKTVRLMRRFHRRPYFVPPMVEVVDRGWMFVSADYTSQTYKSVRCSSQLLSIFCHTSTTMCSVRP